jgi:hypothetical protein
LEEVIAAVWTDGEIDECVTGALEAYGWRFPVEVIATASASEGATTATAPAGIQAIQRVLLADGTAVPLRGRPVRSTAGEEQAWELYAGLLHFSQPLSAQTITIWHTSAPTLADVPAGDEGLLVLGAVLLALQNRAVQDYKRGGDLSSSDHVISHAQDEYDRAIAYRSRRMRAGMVAGV